MDDNKINTAEDKKVEDKKIDEAGEKVDTQTTQKNEGKTQDKTFTQEEVNKLVQDRLDREKRKMPSKEDLDAFSKWKESQKTETEKQVEIQKKLTQKEQEALNLKNENLVLKKGVNADDVDYVLFKVSKLEGNFEENLDSFLKENDKFLKSNSNNDVFEHKDTGVSVNKANTSVKDDGVTAILKAKHPELF